MNLESNNSLFLFFLQLRQEKEQTRYIVVDMVTDSQSVNNIVEQRKQNVEIIEKRPCVDTESDRCKRVSTSIKLNLD